VELDPLHDVPSSGSLLIAGRATATGAAVVRALWAGEQEVNALTLAGRHLVEAAVDVASVREISGVSFDGHRPMV
jgi:hypothetical protein